MAKMLAADASFEAANACIQTHGGFGFAEEYDIERKFRETRLYQVAPISTNLILAYLSEHVLGLPRSLTDGSGMTDLAAWIGRDAGRVRPRHAAPAGRVPRDLRAAPRAGSGRVSPAGPSLVPRPGDAAGRRPGAGRPRRQGRLPAAGAAAAADVGGRVDRDPRPTCAKAIA